MDEDKFAQMDKNVHSDTLSVTECAERNTENKLDFEKTIKPSSLALDLS